MFALLDSNITCQIHPTITDKSPIFGDGGNIAILTNIFEKHYPLFNRRLNYFKSKQQTGQDTLSWIADVRTLATEASIDKITENVIFALVLIVGINDNSTRDAWFREQKPTLPKLITLAKNESVAAQMRKGQKSTHQFINATAHQDQSKKKHKKNTSEKTGSQKTCFYCGGNNHYKKKDCSVYKKQAPCKKCQKLGHLAKVCRSKTDNSTPNHSTKSS